MDREELKKRIESEARAIVPITNADMVCKDCVQRCGNSLPFGNAGVCEAFPNGKPIGVMFRGEGCAEYVKE